MTTAVTHTYLHGSWINSSLFVNALQKCPRECSRFEFAYLTLEDRFTIIREVLTEGENLEKHNEEVSIQNLKENFVFTNYPPCVKIAERDTLR